MKEGAERPSVENYDPLFPSVDHEEKDRLNKLGKIKGKTLEVYYYLVDNLGEYHGVREIQRELDYNSASVAAYHLNRLYEYDLVTKTENGKYFIEGDPVKLGALEDHIKVAGYMVPRILIYGFQAVITIVIAIGLFIADVDGIFWFLYVLIVNIFIIIRVVFDATKISDKLKGGAPRNN